MALPRTPCRSRAPATRRCSPAVVTSAPLHDRPLAPDDERARNLDVAVVAGIGGGRRRGRRGGAAGAGGAPVAARGAVPSPLPEPRCRAWSASFRLGAARSRPRPSRTGSTSSRPGRRCRSPPGCPAGRSARSGSGARRRGERAERDASGATASLPANHRRRDARRRRRCTVEVEDGGQRPRRRRAGVQGRARGERERAGGVARVADRHLAGRRLPRASAPARRMALPVEVVGDDRAGGLWAVTASALTVVGGNERQPAVGRLTRRCRARASRSRGGRRWWRGGRASGSEVPVVVGLGEPSPRSRARCRPGRSGRPSASTSCSSPTASRTRSATAGPPSPSASRRTTCRRRTASGSRRSSHRARHVAVAAEAHTAVAVVPASSLTLAALPQSSTVKLSALRR